EPDGSLDPSFGRVTTTIGHESRIDAVAVRPDQTIVAAGTTWNATNTHVAFARAHYRPDGSLEGVLTTPLPDDLYVLAVTMQPDGRIVAAGTAQDGAIETFAVARYEANGAIDGTFGTGGVAVTNLGNWPTIVSGRASALSVQPDGKIVAAGTVETLTGGGSPTFGLTRYLVTPGCRVPDVRGD